MTLRKITPIDVESEGGDVAVSVFFTREVLFVSDVVWRARAHTHARLF